MKDKRFITVKHYKDRKETTNRNRQELTEKFVTLIIGDKNESKSN